MTKGRHGENRGVLRERQDRCAYLSWEISQRTGEVEAHLLNINASGRKD